MFQVDTLLYSESQLDMALWIRHIQVKLMHAGVSDEKENVVYAQDTCSKFSVHCV